MNHLSEERRRLSYLLRLWQTEQDKALVWRASLESASDGFGQPGERWGFASLDELFAFLERETAQIHKGGKCGSRTHCDQRGAEPVCHRL